MVARPQERVFTLACGPTAGLEIRGWGNLIHMAPASVHAWVDLILAVGVSAEPPSEAA